MGIRAAARVIPQRDQAIAASKAPTSPASKGIKAAVDIANRQTPAALRASGSSVRVSGVTAAIDLVHDVTNVTVRCSDACAIASLRNYVGS